MYSDTSIIDSSEDKVTIICSKKDDASLNIMNSLLQIEIWHQVDHKYIPDDFHRVFESKFHRIIEINSSLIYQDAIDQTIRKSGFEPSLIIFASKHASKQDRKVLTAHFSGNVNSIGYGGRSKELAMSSPIALKLVLNSMKTLCQGGDYEVSLEATHHGPSDIQTPSLFVEIGSKHAQWTDVYAGKIVAQSILQIKNDILKAKKPVALGFGGGHYPVRQSRLIFESGITFGHIFSNYQIKYLDYNLISHAVERTKPDFAFFDKKNLPIKEQKKIENILTLLGIEIIGESEIREMSTIPWSFFSLIRNIANSYKPDSFVKISHILKKQLSSLDLPICYESSSTNKKIHKLEINKNLVDEVNKCGLEELQISLEKLPVIYIIESDGNINNYFFAFNENNICLNLKAKITYECIQILKKHYETKHDLAEGAIYIKKQRFNPKMAQELGVEPGPMFGKLASGNTVKVNTKIITPEMVNDTYTTKIYL